MRAFHSFFDKARTGGERLGHKFIFIRGSTLHVGMLSSASRDCTLGLLSLAAPCIKTED